LKAKYAAHNANSIIYDRARTVPTTKTSLGANAILAVSAGGCQSGGDLQKKIPLYQHISEINGTPGQYTMPVPMMNIINGGEHADNKSISRSL